ncbi:hypothetical protein G3M81_23085 [Bacillus paralicheniformis]|uniref:hypothetical protein n=1 Tax=Bacillus TaxID=1386 RepID=UPI0013EE9A20|nr:MULTISPECIES: hypothetical protein [Bacillus]QII26977.1 hypothetical protein G3M80_20995 [Bacillus altitudinis]QII51445.1 hypothetical protein G3M81_23085 [Bacillus paralicheniformis]
MRNELKVQLPVPIDTKRYLMGKVAFIDVAIFSPFLLLSGLLIYLFYSCGILNKYTFIFSISPSIAIIAFQMIKHPVRKEISYLKYKVLWRYNYKQREKEFFYRKGAFDMADKQDVRRKIGIKSTFADCYETNDKRFVRVFEVSSVNLSLANKPEKKSALESFRVFMTTINFLDSIQISQIAQPINLSRHLQHISKRQQGEESHVKRLLNKGYRNYIENIQKSRELVTRKRYITISKNIGSDREKALDEIDQLSKLLITKVESMTFDYSTLSVKQLNNDELTKLMYTCMDYDNAVSVGDYIIERANDRSSISVGENTAKDLIDVLQRQLTEKVN